jgi:3-deoxy-D-manno-octulosonate 8-phosphate phosphatase (KDO 8-P phosphatase)
MGICDNILENKLKFIKLFVYDFDGVMTDNKVFLDQNGNEMVQVHRGDGYAVARIKEMGIKQLILSTESNPVVSKRAEKLCIPCLQDAVDKRSNLISYCQNENIDIKHVVYIGNDLNDLNVMQEVGVPVCPADADFKIKEISNLVLKSKGGNGVIRELYSIIIRSSDISRVIK